MSEKMWSVNCPWPDPRYPQWGEFDVDEVEEREEKINWRLHELVEIKEYYDDRPDEEDEKDEEWEPEIGKEYWENGEFDEIAWQEDFDEEMGKLKLYGCEAAYDVERLIGYDFADEHLLQQAFTRRSFALEYGIYGSNEELEFIGDSVLNYVLTRMMAKQYGEISVGDNSSHYYCRFDEGEMSRIRSKYVNKEYLAERAIALGLDKYILYGSADKETAGAKEDMVEAVIGAVAIDSDWDYDVLEGVIDQLLDSHIENPDPILKKDMYEIFNSWHQKHFGCMPEYEVYQDRNGFRCTLRFFIPENDKGVNRDQRVDVLGDTRSEARSRAADQAKLVVDYYGLWLNLADSGIEPERGESINQLQELYQKKYIGMPEYSFEDREDGWHCTCICDGFDSWGTEKSKTEAKKTASYKMLIMLFQSAGINRDGWDKSFTMFEE
jgi:dsRNA-specific ribonuclease